MGWASTLVVSKLESWNVDRCSSLMNPRALFYTFTSAVLFLGGGGGGFGVGLDPTPCFNATKNYYPVDISSSFRSLLLLFPSSSSPVCHLMLIISDPDGPSSVHVRCVPLVRGKTDSFQSLVLHCSTRPCFLGPSSCSALMSDLFIKTAYYSSQ